MKKKTMTVSELVAGDIAEIRDCYNIFAGGMIRFLVLGKAEDTCLWEYDHAQWTFCPGDKLCMFMHDARVDVLFEDEEVELLVRAR